MSCDSDDGWIFILGLEVAPNLDSGFYAVHHRHAEVSEDDAVAHAVLVGPLHLVQGFLAVDAKVYLEVRVDAQAVEHCFHRRDAELLVVHH